MQSFIMTQLEKITELLQYFTGSTTTTTATRKYAELFKKRGFDWDAFKFAAGDKVVFAGFSNSDSNGTKTLATVAANEVTVEEAIGTGEAGISATMNQEYQGDWHDVRKWAVLTTAINCSGNAFLYVDQSQDGDNIDYTTTRTITGGTADRSDISSGMFYARLRVRTNAADQTSMRAYLNGRIIT